MHYLRRRRKRPKTPAPQSFKSHVRRKIQNQLPRRRRKKNRDRGRERSGTCDWTRIRLAFQTSKFCAAGRVYRRRRSKTQPSLGPVARPRSR